MAETLTSSRDETQTGATFTDQYSAALAAVRDALAHLRYGQIVLTVHEAKAVQTDVTEKLRFSGS